LELAFVEQKLHRQPKLSLEELAGQLKLPERYVSHLINVYHHGNFHNYVNGWRVKEVIEKINDPAEQHKTLLALALEAGFNSKSSFNQIFKSHTGRTPSEVLRAKP
jgi:AraC-like DNA-binding protein